MIRKGILTFWSWKISYSPVLMLLLQQSCMWIKSWRIIPFCRQSLVWTECTQIRISVWLWTIWAFSKSWILLWICIAMSSPVWTCSTSLKSMRLSLLLRKKRTNSLRSISSSGKFLRELILMNPAPMSGRNAWESMMCVRTFTKNCLHLQKWWTSCTPAMNCLKPLDLIRQRPIARTICSSKS